MFRILGFDVRVQSGFVMFTALIVFLYRSPFGYWLAGSIAVLTLIHELGHATAARRAGADAEISLGFFAGYASYRPTRPISRARQAWISFAGPGIHIAVSVTVLLAMGFSPFDMPSTFSEPAAAAIWWAGPAIGMMNLIPVLPLDGGHIMTYGMDYVVPGRAHRYMLFFSIALTSASAVLLVATGYRGFVLFVGFLLISQFQMLNAGKAPQVASSPWNVASDALDAGKAGKARRILFSALSHPQPTRTAPPSELSTERAAELIDLLPEPLPQGDPSNEYVLARLLLETRRFGEAAHYAADSFQRHPSTLTAAIVARSAGALDDQATAIGWLRT
ncbi:metalloprotease, partial [Ilumatobacter sp.]|uniref:metalloprotease n=1 Tax=Ilumatobacter sp. TaxID=1967498 RepID=UPI003C331FA3